mgnify:CR=1 FL=1
MTNDAFNTFATLGTAVFDTSSRIPGDKFSYALNQSLPEDIVIRKSEEVANDFHPRKVDSRKTYRYSIWHDRFPMPTNSRYTYWVYTALDTDAMRKAAGYFAGEHDFAAFCSAAADVESTVRTIYDMKVECPDEHRIDIFVTGGGFLYNMVRIIAGTLIEVGEGKISPDVIPDIINSRDRSKAGKTAPAKGLTLIGYSQ